MFAHHVIEHIINVNKRAMSYDNMEFCKRMMTYIPMIQNSQIFYFGDTDLYNVVKIQTNQPYLKEFTYLQLPFDIVTLEYTYKNGKMLLCIKKITETIVEIMGFQYMNKNDSWDFAPYPILGIYGGYTHANNRNEIVNLLEKYNIFFQESIIDEIISSGTYAYMIPIMSLQEAEILGPDIDKCIRTWNGIIDKMERSLMLLNCKNIQIEKIPAPAKLNKKRIRSGKLPIYDYHVLNLVLPSNKKRGYQEQSVPLSHNRVHLCRGHFKEYTKEHPLFGKYTGLYWWEPSVRGQNRKGVVMKDYEVKLNNNDS